MINFGVFKILCILHGHVCVMHFSSSSDRAVHSRRYWTSCSDLQWRRSDIFPRILRCCLYKIRTYMYIWQIPMWRSHSNDTRAEEHVLLEELLPSEVERPNSNSSVGGAELYWIRGICDRNVWSQMCAKRLYIFFV